MVFDNGIDLIFFLGYLLIYVFIKYFDKIKCILVFYDVYFFVYIVFLKGKDIFIL